MASFVLSTGKSQKVYKDCQFTCLFPAVGYTWKMCQNMMMNLSYLVVLISCCTLVQGAVNSEEALKECGNLHHLEFRTIPNARAELSNSNCMLKCEIANATLSNEPINEGFACPTDANGVREGYRLSSEVKSLISDVFYRSAKLAIVWLVQIMRLFESAPICIIKIFNIHVIIPEPFICKVVAHLGV